MPARLIVENALSDGHAAEFPGFKIAPEIDAAIRSGHLIDASWHNDSCPSFIRAVDKATFDRDMDLVRVLWTEHEIAEQREAGGPRYLVQRGAEVIYQGEELVAALSAMR